MIALRRCSLFVLAVVALFPIGAAAANSELRVLIDVDNNIATGCVVGGMSGVDQVLVTQVVDSDTAANVVQTHRLVCNSGILSGPTDVVTTGWPAGWQSSSGMMLVETRIPFSALSSGGMPSIMRLGFDGTRGTGTFSVTTTPSGGAILFPVPTHRRRAVGFPGDDRMIVMDGDGSDWGMINPLTTGAGGGASALKLLKVFGFANPLDSFIYFNFNLNTSGSALLAIDDVFARKQGSSLTQPAPGVLANDQPNTLPLTANPVSTPANGLLTLNPDGSFTYTPYSPNSLSPDFFEYKAVSGSDQSNTAKVRIEVTKTNLAPKVTPATFSVNENSPNGTTVGTVTATDANVGDHLTFSIVSGNTGNAFAINATTGVITVNTSAQVNFEVHPQFNLVVRATDDGVPPLFDNGSITINVNNVNDAPVAVADAYSVAEEGTLNIAAPGVLANDTDEDVPHTLTAVLVSGPSHQQSFALNPNGSFNYTPVVNYVGNDVFSYRANDGSLDSNIVTVTITITPVNDPPSFLVGSNQTVNEDAGPQTVLNWATAISPGPPDEAGQNVSFVIDNNSNPGLFSAPPAVAPNGTLTYTPAPNANGLATITLHAVDDGPLPGVNASGTQNFTITVNPVNDPPTFTLGGNQTVPEDSGLQTVPGFASSISVGPADESGQTITSFNVSNDNNALFALQPQIAVNGTLTYTPAADAFGTATVSVTATDSGGATSSPAQTFTITVTPVNDAPTMTAGGTLNYTENDPATAIDTTITVSDIDSTTLAGATVQLTTNYANGQDFLALAPMFGISGTFVQATGTLTLTGTASLANYQTALRSVTYVNTSDNPSALARTVVWQVNDGAGVNNFSNQPTSTINVTPVNDAPVIIAGSTRNYTEGDPALTLEPALSVTDVDSPNVLCVAANDCYATISGNPDVGNEVLACPACGGFTPSYNLLNNTLTLTGAGTFAQLETAMRSITYAITTDNPLTAPRGIDWFAKDSAGAQNADTLQNDTAVNVTAVNDAPVVTTTGGTTAFVEDGGPVAVDNGVTVTDPDNTTLASATVTITNLIDSGLEVLAANTGGTSIVANYSAPTLTLTGVDTLANYQTVLRSVTYNNNSNTPTTTNRVIAFQVNDGTVNSNVANKSVSVAVNNDAPTVTTSGGVTSFTEGAGAVVVDANVTPADVDNTTLSSATVTISNLLDAGQETLAASTGGTSITANYVAPTLTLSGVDSIANYQQVLRSVTYNNASLAPTTTDRVINFQVNDGALNSNVAAKTVSITAVNSAPTIATTVGTTAFVEDAGAVIVDSGVTPADVDNTTLASATVTITNNLDGALEVLAANTGGTSIVANYVAPTLTLTGVDTLANYQTVLRSVTYNNSSNTPNTTTRVVAFQVNDGALNSNTATKDVSVTPTNDPPTITTSVGTSSFTEGGGPVVVDANVTPADVDSPTLSSATVTISNLLDAGLETLAATTGGTSITANYVAPTLTLSGVDSIANYQQVLRSVTYDNASNAPNTTNRVINFRVNDGALNSNIAGKTVSVTSVNSAPTISTSGGTTAFVEDAGAVVVDSGVTPADVDSTTLASATVTITNNLDGALEVLAANTGGTSIVANYVAPTLTLTGVDTIANYQTVLRSVTYNNNSNTPNTTNRVIDFKVNDGSLDSNTASKTVSVAPANDAPTVTTSGGNSTFTEGGGAVVVDANVTPADVDSPTLASATVTISNLLDAGQETLAATTGGTSITANYVAPTLTLTGVDSIANYQQVLRSVTYNNGSNAPNTTDRVINFRVNDGALNSNIAAKNVTVISVNSAPTITTSVGTTAFVEDGGSVVVDSGVTPADVDSSTLASATVTITNLSDAGLEVLSATTGGTSITANYVAPTLTLTGVDTIANYQTVLRSVRYNNTSNTPNTTTRVISFKVNDGSLDSNTATKNVSVTPANDAPVVTTTGGNSAFTEDGGAVTVDSGVTVTDVDSPTMSSATVTISNLLNAGAEFLAASTGGTSITANYVAPTLTLSGVDSIANYQTVLRSVTYDNTSQNPNTTTRTINFQVNDGAANSNIAGKGVTVAAVNDAPVVTTTVGTTAFTEDGGPVAVDNGLAVTDVDSPNMSSATVTITNLADATFEFLAATTGGTSITANYVAPTLTLSGVDSIANYQTVLRSVTYNNTSNNPTTTTRTIAFQVNDGALNSNTANKSVSVTAANDAPTLTLSGTLAYTENQVATALNVTASITDPDNTTMSSATVSITGNFQSGADVLGFTTQNGITGNYVAPTLTLTGSSSIANYVTALQSVTYQNTSDNPSTSARTVTWQVNDGAANSNTQTSTINITATNDPPVNNLPTNAQSVNEDTPLTFTGAGNTVSVTDPDAQSGNISVQIVTTNGTTTIVTPTGITFAPPAGNGTASYTITGTLANVNTSLGTLRFDPTLNFPGAAASGTATITLNTNDNGNTPAPAQTDNGDVFNITVNQVNDAPTAVNEAFDTIGNTELRIDLTAGTTPNVAHATGSSNGVRANDSDPVEGNPFTVTSIVGCVDVVTPYDCTLASGSLVSMNSDGTFNFRPSPTIISGAPTDDSFQYVITDQPVAGTPQTATGTVTIHVYDKVWYVKEGASGNGRSDNPLGSFTGINNAGGAGDSDVAGDYIFVHRNTATAITSNIELEANQHLLGEGVALSINRNLNTDGAPTNLVAAGTKPPVTSATNTVSIVNGVPVEIRGLDLTSTGNGLNAIDMTSAAALTGSSTLTISDNAITTTGTTAEGIDVNLNAGTTGTVTLAVSNNSVNATGNGIDLLRNNAGTLQVSALNDNVINGNTGGTGISVVGTGASVLFDNNPGTAAFDTVSGGTTVIGASGNNVGGSGLVLNNIRGDLSFTDLDVYADATALLINGTSPNYTGTSGTRVTANTNSPVLLGNGGPAANLTDANVNLVLNTLTSTNSAGTGVSLLRVSGTFTAPSGSSITNATGADFNIDGNSNANANVNVTYGGTITDDVGALITVTNVTAASTHAFSGAITDNFDGDGGEQGITLTGNSGATMTFSGGVSIRTTTNAAFTATGGGTLNICDENPCNPGADGATVNRLTSTTGNALNVSNTNIGANNLEFQSISSNGGSSNGIILSTTGTAGGLKVKGTGVAGSGGTIANKTGANGSTTDGTGIYLNSTSGVSFDRMQLNDFQNYAIRGTSVTGFSLTNSIVNGANGTTNGGGSEEDSIRFDGLFTSGAYPTAQITNSTVSGGFTNNLRVLNVSGTLNRLMLTNNTFGLINAANGNDNVAVSAVPPSPTTATTNVTLQDCNFLGTRGDFFETIADGNSTMDVVARRNKFTNGQAIIPGGGVALSIRGDVTGTADNVTFDLSCNNIVGGHTSTGIFVAKGNGGGTWSGAIVNNSIGAASGAGGDGIFARAAGSGTISLLIENNTVTGYGNVGYHLQNNDGSSTMNATLFGNVVTAPHAGAFAGLFVDNGATATDTSTANVVVGSATVAADKNDFSAGDPANFSDVSLSNFSASTTFRLYKNGSASGTAATVIDDDNLNPGTTNTDTSGGVGTITLVTAGLPAAPATPATCTIPP